MERSDAEAKEALRQLALTVLRRHAGPEADAQAIAAAADRAYADLARVLAPVIGDIGVSALTDRALHVAQREYPWLVRTHEGAPADRTFSHVIASLKGQDPAVATDAAGAVFAMFLGVLATFIGEPLAARLVRQAWPGDFSGAHTEET